MLCRRLSAARHSAFSIIDGFLARSTFFSNNLKVLKIHKNLLIQSLASLQNTGAKRPAEDEVES